MRKPDLLAVREGIARITDVQVVSGYCNLDEAHRRKKSYYADNPDILKYVVNNCGIPPTNMGFHTITLTWRGIWTRASAMAMTSMGLTRMQLRAITTRAIHGSYLNFKRFGKITTVRNRHIWPFRIRR
ncbi:hypothetical protein KM043_016459 [Ampulex compressa]|nr:hypothetical protein KM043_016459 [Ampulex compressa]